MSAPESVEQAPNYNWIGELIFAAVLLYFARQAQPMLAYYDSMAMGEQLWNRADGFFESVLAFVIKWNSEALGFLTIGLPVLIYLERNTPNDNSDAGTAISFLMLAGLGWWIGREFAKAYARKAACQAQGGFFNICTMNGEPMISFWIYSFIVVCLAVSVALALVGRALHAFGVSGSASNSRIDP